MMKEIAKTKITSKKVMNNKAALGLLCSLFFMWGFITCLNDILIPHLKDLFELNYTQIMLIQFTFFGAYFIMSLPSGWIIGKIGYKNGIVLGLAVTGIGALLFYPSAALISYAFFLGAFFILASGITILQVAANAYVSILGPPETASGRLNLTQAFNSLGTTIAPIFGSILILSNHFNTVDEKAKAVQGPYIGIAIALFVVAIIFAVIKLPTIKAVTYKKEAGSAWSYRHLVLGAVAIFFYVGAEVSIGSFLINFFGEKNIAGLAHSEAAKYVALYWGGAMIGRFFGAISLSNMKKGLKQNLYILAITIFAFLLAWYLTKEIKLALLYLILVGINIAAFHLGKNKPNRTLGIFALIAVILVSLTMIFSGKIAMWPIIGVGLFNSIMFPTIFTLSIDGLGKHTSQGSGILCMSIVGGAIIPLLMGVLADNFGIHHSFLITLVCYLYIVFYAFKGYKHSTEQVSISK